MKGNALTSHIDQVRRLLADVTPKAQSNEGSLAIEEMSMCIIEKLEIIDRLSLLATAEDKLVNMMS